MHESIGARLKAWRKAESIGQEDAAVRLGMSSSTYQNYERDVRSPNAESCKSFAEAGINVNWLLTGEGQMLLQIGHGVAETRAEYRVDSGQLEPGYVSVPFFDGIRVSAGPGGLVESEIASKAIKFSEVWLRNELGVNPAYLGLAMVEGDSMEPTFRSGALVLFDRSVNRLVREGLYIIRSGEMVMVKRVRARIDGGVEIISDNTAYERFVLTPEELEAANFTVLGRVVWGDRRF